MNEENLQTWLDETLDAAQVQLCTIDAETLDDTFGWGKLLQTQYDPSNVYETANGRGILLSGPDGCGKHTAAAYMIRILDEAQYVCIFLDAIAFTADGMDVAALRLKTLLDHTYDLGEGLCIMLENAEQCRCRKQLLTVLGQHLSNYWLNASQLPPLFLILIDQREKDIPSILRRRMRLCRMSMPNSARRIAFFEKNAKKIMECVSREVIASATEGMTYAQLGDFTLNLYDLMESHFGTMNDEDFVAFAAEQMPPAEPEDITKTLADSIRKLVDQLPQMLRDAAESSHLAAPAPQQVVVQEKIIQPAAPSAPVDERDFIASRRKQVEDMPFKNLAFDLFGEEGSNDLNEYAASIIAS